MRTRSPAARSRVSCGSLGQDRFIRPTFNTHGPGRTVALPVPTLTRISDAFFFDNLARVLLPCMSENFSAVDFFQKYSVKVLSHLWWTLDGYSVLVIGV